MSLVCPVVSCAGVAGGAAEAVGPDRCRIPSEPAARKRRVTRPACAVSPRVGMVREMYTALNRSMEYRCVRLQG